MRDEVKMDANRLIAEVYKRPALWNQRHMSYHNREVTNRVWMEIASIFKLPKPVLKAKWKGLRDTFRAELKKEQVFQKSKFHRNRPVWIHFKSLQFLKEQMLPRPPIWERAPHAENDRTSESEGETQNGIQSSLDENDVLAADHLHDKIDNKISLGKADATNVSSSNGHHHHRRGSNSGNGHHHNNNHAITVEVKQEPEENFESLEFHNVAESQLTADNEMMLQNISPDQVLMSDGDSNVGLTMDPLLENNRCDDNYYFLMSLLPHIRTLPADRRMLLRMQMLELVYKEVYKKGGESSTTS